jgi:hypothetical protein
MDSIAHFWKKAKIYSEILEISTFNQTSFWGLSQPQITVHHLAQLLGGGRMLVFLIVTSEQNSV